MPEPDGGFVVVLPVVFVPVVGFDVPLGGFVPPLHYYIRTPKSHFSGRTFPIQRGRQSQSQSPKARSHLTHCRQVHLRQTQHR